MTKEQEKAAMPAAKKAVIEAARKRVEAKKGPQKASAPTKSAPKAEPKKKNKLIKAGETFMKGMMSIREKQMKKAGM